MAIDFSDLIPAATKEKPTKTKIEDSFTTPPEPSYNELIRRKLVPVRGGRISFEDLVPENQRIAYPKVTPEQLALAQKAMAMPREEIPFKMIMPLRRPRETPTAVVEPSPFAGVESEPLSAEDRPYRPPLPGPQFVTTPADAPRISKPPKIFQDIRDIWDAAKIMTDPKTPEGRKLLDESIYNRLKWSLTYALSLGGRVGPKSLRGELAAEAEEFGGYGPAVVPAAGQTAQLAFEWGWLYPKLFKAVGLGGKTLAKIPKIQRGMTALKRLGGLKKVALKYPRFYEAGKQALGAFVKGEVVGQTIGGAEVLGKDMSAVDILKHINKQGAILGGVATIFSIVSSIDTVRYALRLRTELINISKARYDAKIKALPRGMANPKAKALITQEKLERQIIDNIVSAVEAELTGIKTGRLYRLGQEKVESPLKTAERIAKYGIKPGTPYPKGEPLLKKGLGRPMKKPLLPTTRAGEITESAKEFVGKVAHPAKTIREIQRPIRPPTLPSAPKTIQPAQVVKRHAVEIMPGKQQVLREIDEALKAAPSEQALRTKLEKEIPEPASTLPTEEWSKLIQAKQNRISEEVAKLQEKRIDFKIDGGAKIINTKEALTKFRQGVVGLPEKEYRPAAKKAAPAKKKPIAAKRETIDKLHKAPEGYFTDGRLLVKGKPPAKAKYVPVSEEAKGISQEGVNEILSAETQPAEFQHYAVRSPEYGEGISERPIAEIGEAYEPAVAVFKSGDKYYTYEQGRFNVIRNRYPDVDYGIKPESGVLITYKEGEPVAALMPRLIGEAKEPGTEQPSEFFVEDLVPEPKHISKVVIDTFREWPPQIKKVGKDYWTEVMAAAKSLMTPLRYKALRQTMLGVFRLKKAPGVPPKAVDIELQDVTDALSATHELGHNIDWLLNDKKYPSSITARFPQSYATESVLRAELKMVSKGIRPDLWKLGETRRGRHAYVNRHTELMADYISFYILDPEGAAGLAPKMTNAFEQKLANKPELFETVSRLQESRYEGPEEPPVAEYIREKFPLPKEFTPLQLRFDMTDKDYVKAAEELGITAVRHYKLLIHRAQVEALRVDKLVPNKDRQTDLVVVAERGSKNPWTGQSREQIEKTITPNERKAINLFRGYQEKARQTVDKYLRGADIAEYIKFIEDYFLHAYQTPLTEKYKSAISRWAKRSPQVKKRVLPDLATAVEIGLKPRAKTLSEGLSLWAGINYRVATNLAFLRILPQITNDDGVSVLQKPQDFPFWPTVDYWPIRQTYVKPLEGRGVLLFQGRVAVDPRVKPFIDAMFGRRVFNTPVRIIEGLNAVWKGFQLTLFSFFHHQAEFFSACGSLGPRALPFVGGYYGKRAQAFGKKKLFGFLPSRIGVLKAGKQLERVPEFMDDYINAGGQLGYITTEGINRMEQMLKGAEDYLKNIIQTRPIAGKAVWIPYIPAKTARAVYAWFQHLLWDNTQRAKLVTYYSIVADGAKNSDLPIKQVKETAAKYIADNFGGQEWLNTMFRKPKTRQFWTQLAMSLDWSWSQIKTARWPFAYGGKTETEKARRALMRKIGRHHWFWYLAAVAGFSVAGNYAMNGKGPWDNETGHRLDIDWTNIWRNLPWNRNWKQRGDYSRRYIGLGKAGRELVRWVTSPLRAFGYKMSPVARSLMEQGTGYGVGSGWAEPWAREDLELYQEVYARFKHLMENFRPFAFSGNNAFLAFPSRKGMTHWKAVKTYEEIFNVRANIATGGLTAKLTKASHILDKNAVKLNKEIIKACEINHVDWERAMRAALANVRSKNYRRFWNAAKQQDVKACNRYATGLLALGVTETGFTQSLRIRGGQLSKEAARLGIDTFLERQRIKRAK